MSKSCYRQKLGATDRRPDRTLDQTCERIHGVMSGQTMTREHYMELYTNTRYLLTQGMVDKVFIKGKSHLATYLIETRHLVLNEDEPSVLVQYYADRWEDYKFRLKVLNGACCYLNQHSERFLKKETKIQQRKIYSIGMQLWWGNMAQLMQSELRRAIVKLIRQYRDGKMVNTRRIARVLNS